MGISSRINIQAHNLKVQVGAVMVEQPNLFWFGLVLWVGGVGFFLNLLRRKTPLTPDLTQQYDFDALLSEKLHKVGMASWDDLRRAVNLPPSRIKQLRQGRLDNLSFQALNQIATTLDWPLEDLLQAYGVPFSSLDNVFQEVNKLHQQSEQVYQEKQALQQELTTTQTRLNTLSHEAEQAQERVAQLEAELQNREQAWQARLETTQHEVAQLQQQCRRLRTEAQHQAEITTQEVIASSFGVIQTLFMNFPTARMMVNEKPTLPARNFMSLFLPLEKLLKKWGYEPIGTAWEQVEFDPTLHQADDSTLDAGESVYVRFVGYRNGDRVVCPAKVSRTLPLP